MPDIDGDTRLAIMVDVANGTKVEDSKVDYTADALRLRAKLEDWAATLPAGAVIDIPADLPPTSIEVTPLPRP